MSQIDPVGIKSVRQVLLLLEAWGMPKGCPNNPPGVRKNEISPDFKSFAITKREPTFQIARPVPF